MKFKYTICYADREEIDYFDKPILADDLHSLVKNFNWADELAKKIEYYAPSLDFIKLDDKKRIILSGIGKGKLELFQVMYLVPESIDFENVFNEDNYENPDCFSKEVTILKGYELLQDFIDGNYDKLVDSLDEGIVYEPDEIEYTPTVLEYDKDEVHEKPSFSKSSGEFREKSKIEQVMFRILGPVVSLIFFGIAFFFYALDETLDVMTLLFGGVGLLFFLGTLKFEWGLSKRNNKE